MVLRVSPPGHDQEYFSDSPDKLQFEKQPRELPTTERNPMKMPVKLRPHVAAADLDAIH